MNKLLSGLAATALLGLSAVALGAGFRHQPGSATWTDTAGATGTASVDLVTGADFFGVQALKLWEFDRRTCSLQLEQGSLNTQSSAVLDAMKVCEPKLSESWKRADVGAGQFVTAVAVCTAKGKNAGPEIHGVELVGSALLSDGKLKAAKKPVRIEFAHCEKWSPRRSCPAGSVATAVRAYTDGERGAVGLSLRCHQIEVTN